MNRIDNYERMYLGESLEMPEAASRIDALWQAILNKEELPFEPVTRIEKYLAKMIDNTIETPNPTTKLEEILCAICRGEKVDEATKVSCKDEYLKYIYEQVSGENLFVPNNSAPYSSISCNGRKITINGKTTNQIWRAQLCKRQIMNVGDVVTLRYRYISGNVTSTTDTVLSFAPAFLGEEGATKWAGETILNLTASDCLTEKISVFSVSKTPEYFGFFASTNAAFDNLTFELIVEKGDTTK